MFYTLFEHSALYQSTGDGNHLTHGLTEGVAAIFFSYANRHSIRALKAHYDIRFKRNPGRAIRALFLLSQIVQICIANISTLQPDSKTWRSS